MNVSGPAARIGQWLSVRRSVLVVTHERPDGDAIGSLLGLALALRSGGCPAWAYLRDPVPARYRRALGRGDGASTVLTSVLPPAIEGLVYVDAATAERAELPPGLNPAAASLVRLNIDHHADNTRFGDLVWVDATMSATAQMILRLLPAAAIPLTREVATCLLVGVIMDTGGYRFPNTRAAALRDTAELVEAGADYAATIDSLFFQEPYPRRLLEARILQNATFAHQGRVLYAVVGEDWFRTAGVDPADTEGLIDPLRSVAGVDIASLIQVDGAVVRFSLRSRSAAIPVNLIARALGGGGHAQAAGAKVTGLTLEQAETRLLDLTGKALGLG